jgi:hypothetical protein
LARRFLALLASFVLFSHHALPQSCFLRHFFNTLVELLNDETNYYIKQSLFHSQIEESSEIRPFFHWINQRARGQSNSPSWWARAAADHLKLNINTFGARREASADSMLKISVHTERENTSDTTCTKQCICGCTDDNTCGSAHTVLPNSKNHKRKLLDCKMRHLDTWAAWRTTPRAHFRTPVEATRREENTSLK